MSWICRNTRTLFHSFCTAVLALNVTACANTGPAERIGNALPTPSVQQAVPEFVRNLPKSSTGNMAEYTVFGKRYEVLDSAAGFIDRGTASWYGEKFHGRKTSSGDIYDMHAMTAAHKNLPLPTFVRVTNLENNSSVVVKVNDRGPFVGDRIIDLSLAAALELGMKEQGTANVQVQALSTHLVAENDTVSNRGVVESFAQQQGDNDGATPEVIEPALAAVPLRESAVAVEQFEKEVEPGFKDELVLNAELEGDNDNGDDGYVELVAEADAAPVAKLAIEAQSNESQLNEAQLNEAKAAQIQPLASAVQPELGSASSSAESSSAEASTESGYFIQLGAFRYAPYAEAMVDSVVEKTGLNAFIEVDATKALYRVKMGPYEKGDGLETTMTELASIGIEGYTKLATEP